jgi:ABC-type glycerol-3-phosphate transport system permease component
MMHTKGWVPRRILLAVVCLALAFAFLFPVAWQVATSLKPEPLIPTWPPKWSAGVVTFQNYRNIMFGLASQGVYYDFFYWLRNSLIVAVVATALTIFLGSLAGYSFARFRFKGHRPLFMLAIATIIIPQEITIVPLYIALTRMGFSDTFFGLIMPVVANPVSIFLFKQFFDGFPKDLEEAALIDGYGRFRIWWKLVMPLSTAVILAVAILTFTASWNDMLWPIIITSTKKAATLPVGIVQHFEMFQGAKVVLYGNQSAITILAILPTLLVFILLQKNFVQGIARTGIKE